MDSKIIAALIISIAAIICVYLYTENTPLKQCIRESDGTTFSHETTVFECIRRIYK